MCVSSSLKKRPILAKSVKQSGSRLFLSDFKRCLWTICESWRKRDASQLRNVHHLFTLSAFHMKGELMFSLLPQEMHRFLEKEGGVSPLHDKTQRNVGKGYLHITHKAHLERTERKGLQKVPQS